MIVIDRKVVEKAYAFVKRETAMISLTTNSSNTEFMIMGRNRSRLSDVRIEVVIDREEFEVVDELVYLTTLTTCDNDVSRKMERR